MNGTQTSGVPSLREVGEAMRIQPPTQMTDETREAWAPVRSEASVGATPNFIAEIATDEGVPASGEVVS